VHNGLPVEVGFWCSKSAVGEIGKRRVEADDAAGLALALGAVTAHACRSIELLARPLRQLTGQGLSIGTTRPGDARDRQDR